MHGTRENIWANRLLPGGSWGEPELLEMDDSGSALYPKVATSADGTAMIMWTQAGLMHAVRDVPPTGFVPADPPPMTADGVSRPAVSMDASGNAVGIWSSTPSAGGVLNAWASSFTAASTMWSTPELVEMDDAGNALGIAIDMNSSGVATAVWYQSDTMRFNMVASRFE